MVICADTSFLYALYGHDCHSSKAIAWVSGLDEPIQITSLTDFELRNSLRFAECRKLALPGSAEEHLEKFDGAIADERLTSANCNLAHVLREANRLSLAHTLTGGHRGFDILHVAAAKILKATHFLTFDANQKKLAEAEGFIVPL